MRWSIEGLDNKMGGTFPLLTLLVSIYLSVTGVYRI